MNDLQFLENGAVEVAQELIGWRLYKQDAGELIGGMITETEAYTQADAASHTFSGQTPRNEIMFGPAGHIYVYFTYGMHYCMNIVAGKIGYGEGVLIRSIQLDKGIETVRQRRGHKPDADLTNGPAKICQALDVSTKDNGGGLNKDVFILLPPSDKVPKIRRTKRIGIKKDAHRLWRFVAI
jgi:DNA-3-methyladenine glycosylase